MEKISGVYKIENIITGDFYIGSSKDVKNRWVTHKCPSQWKARPNSLLYKDMQKYGVENFRFQIICYVMPDYLKQTEQEFIEMLHPSYNNYNANGIDTERKRKSQEKAQRKYNQSNRGKETHRKYYQSDKGMKSHKKCQKKYFSQLCSYNGTTLTLCALAARFQRAGIKHPVIEAKKYLIEN